MMTHTFEHQRDPEVTVNLLTAFSMKVQHLQNGIYFNIPYFKGTKVISIKIDFSYEGSEGRINNLSKAIEALRSQVRGLCKFYTEKKLSLNKETNVLHGKIEIHFFRPKPICLGFEIKEDQANAFNYQEEDLEPLSAGEIMSEVTSTKKEFIDLLQ